MIRYDILWHDLVRDLNETRMQYEINAQELDKANAKDLALINRRIGGCIENRLIKTQREFDRMKEKDEEEQHNVDSFQFHGDSLYVSGHDWNKWEDKWHVINEEPIESISCYYEYWEVGLC